MLLSSVYHGMIAHWYYPDPQILYCMLLAMQGKSSYYLISLAWSTHSKDNTLPFYRIERWIKYFN